MPVLFICVGVCHLCGIVYTTLRVKNIRAQRSDISKSDNWKKTIRNLFSLTHLRDCFRQAFEKFKINSGKVWIIKEPGIHRNVNVCRL